MSEKDNAEDDDLKGKGEDIDDEDTDLLEEDDDSDDNEDDGEDDKPIIVTKKQLDALVSKQIDSRFANKRRDNKNRGQPYKPNSKKVGDEENPLNERLDKIEISQAKRDFGYKHGLSPEAVDIVFRFAGNKPTSKTLEDPFIKGGLERLKTQASLRDNTPDGSSSSSFEVDGKKFEELDTAGKQKNFAAKQKAILQKKRGQ